MLVKEGATEEIAGSNPASDVKIIQEEVISHMYYDGGKDIMVIAYECQDLGIRCRCCGYELGCGTYYTKQYDYSNM